MNDLIIIGNGFDLAHGLKSRYSDFILDYLTSVYYDLLSGHSIDNPLFKIDNTYGGVPHEMRIDTINDFLKFLDTYNLNIRYKTRFFIDILSDSNNWMNIEYLYYKHVLILFRELERTNVDQNDDVTKRIKFLNSALEYIKQKFVKYLKIELKRNINYYSNRSSIENHFTEILNISSRTYVLNFNYTSTPERYVAKDIPVNYIHGEIDEPLENIIFGYGDEMDDYYHKLERLNQHEFIKNFKSHGYFLNNRYNDISQFVYSERYNIHILGHSCGLSDRILLNQLLDSDLCHRIYIYYHTKDELKYKGVEISRNFRPESKHKMRKKLNFELCKPLIDPV